MDGRLHATGEACGNDAGERRKTPEPTYKKRRRKFLFNRYIIIFKKLTLTRRVIWVPISKKVDNQKL